MGAIWTVRNNNNNNNNGILDIVYRPTATQRCLKIDDKK